MPIWLIAEPPRSGAAPPQKGLSMSVINEFAGRLGLSPVSAANPGAYATYIASLIVEFGAGGGLFAIIALRFGRGILRWVSSWSIAPEHLIKLAIPIICLLTSAGLLSLDIR
jgi:hypothetical protein